MKKHLLALAVAVLALTAPRADAALLINIYNSGSDVTMVASGSFNYLPTGSVYFGGVTSYLNPGLSGVGLFPNSGVPQYKSYSLISSPANFGTLNVNRFPDYDISSNWNFSLNQAVLVLPSSYTAGTSVSGTATFLNKTIYSLSLTAGTYYYTWGDGVNTDTATLVISETAPGPAAVPEPGTWAAAGLLLGVAGFARWRKRAKVS